MRAEAQSFDEMCDDMIRQGEVEPREALLERLPGISKSKYTRYRFRHWTGMWIDDPYPGDQFLWERAQAEWHAMFGDALRARLQASATTEPKPRRHLRLVYSAD